MEKDSLLQRLYLQVETELEYCNEKDSPFICSQYNDMDSRANIIKTIAETCVDSKLTISEAINKVERTYSNNSLD